jgi:hypothetical protein
MFKIGKHEKQNVLIRISLCFFLVDSSFDCHSVILEFLMLLFPLGVSVHSPPPFDPKPPSPLKQFIAQLRAQEGCTVFAAHVSQVPRHHVVGVMGAAHHQPAGGQAPWCGTSGEGMGVGVSFLGCA